MKTKEKKSSQLRSFTSQSEVKGAVPRHYLLPPTPHTTQLYFSQGSAPTNLIFPVKDTPSLFFISFTFPPPPFYTEGVSIRVQIGKVKGVALNFWVELFLIPLEPNKVVFSGQTQSDCHIRQLFMGDTHQITRSRR